MKVGEAAAGFRECYVLGGAWSGPQEVWAVHLFEPDQPQNVGMLVRVFIVLGVLLIAQTTLGLLGDILLLFDRFRSVLYLFVIGALLAYLMAPAVRMLQHVVRKQWAAVICAYLLLFACALGFGALLLTPFVSEAKDLIKNLENPSKSSLVRLLAVKNDYTTVVAGVNAQAERIALGQPVPVDIVQQTQSVLATLVHDASVLTIEKTPDGVVAIPPSYANPLVATARQLQSAYRPAVSMLNAAWLARFQSQTNLAARQANATYDKAASTPLLLLNLQADLDHRGVSADLHDKFSEGLKSINSQISSLLNNAVNIGLQAGSLLLDIVLIFIISIYFLHDGSRFVRWITYLAPRKSRPQVSRAMVSLDELLGRYVRTQIVLALLAGLADACGAVILGIPYAIVIFFSSFLLSLVPVLGPVILPIPPLTVALIFTPLPKPIFYLVWLLIGEQIVTNVVGPRLQAHHLRIHPLEAMAAALIGLPLAGLPGAFFAVPIVAFFHVVIQELVNAQRTAPADSAAPEGTPPPSTVEAREPRSGP